MNRMMKSGFKFRVVLAVVCLCFSGVSSVVVAQGNIGEQVPMALQKMKKHKWDEAHKLLDEVTKLHAERGEALFGGKFGSLYYYKGYCELKIGGKYKKLNGDANAKKSQAYYQLARESFKKSNGIGQGNVFQTRSLLYWGQAEQALGEYKEAINLYQRFQQRIDPKVDVYKEGMFHMNMAICYFRLGEPNLKEVNKHLELGMKLRESAKSEDNDALYEISKAMLEKGNVKEGTKLHDLYLHLYGFTQLYKRMHAEAQPHLEKHLKLYPNSEYHMAARYFEAVNLSRLYEWEKAAVKLDQFLTDFSDVRENIYLPFALYERANTHFNQAENGPALDLLERLEKEFKGSGVEGILYVLKGDIYRDYRNKKASENAYIKGLEHAEASHDREVAGMALYHLVALLGVDREDNEAITDAIKWYDKFWKEYQDSPYRTQVAATGIPALMAAKPSRGDEALANLQGVILDLARQKGAPDIEKAINIYCRYYLESGKTLENLKKHIENLLGIVPDNMNLQALYRIELIGVYEDHLIEAQRKGNKVEEARLTKETIQLYNVLQKQVRIKDLSNFILMRQANALSKSKVAKVRRRALAFCDEILNRKDSTYRSRARIKKAKILAQGNKPEKVIAKELLLKVIEENKQADTKAGKKVQDNGLTDQAYHTLIELYHGQGEWKSLEEACKTYKRDGYRGKTPTVSYLLAVSYEKQNKHKEAMAVYDAVSNRYRTHWDIAVPTCLRGNKLRWNIAVKEGDESGKQAAYDSARKFLKS